MSAERYLWHVTLNTGHGRRSPRSEVSAAAIEAVGRNLDEALAAGTFVPLTGPPGYLLKADAVGASLTASVAADSEHGPMPLVTFGVALRARNAGRLWRLLHDVKGYDFATDPEVVAKPPWCAVRLYDTIGLDMAAMAWLGDFERCAAWAWIERDAAS
jgi:hypothetical protein